MSKQMDSVDGVLMKSSNKASMDDIVIKKNVSRISDMNGRIPATYTMLSPLYFTTERTWHITVAGMCFVWNALLRIMYAMLYTFTAIYAGRRRSE